MNSFRDALSPLRARMPKSTREVEVLRIVGQLDSSGLTARKAVLKWVERKAAQQLPSEAWSGSDFELLNGGRHAFAANLKTEALELWSVRSDDPDKEIAGRIWTTEVTIGGQIGKNSFFTVRQLMTTQEEDYCIEAAAPSFVSEVLQNDKLAVNGRLALNVPENVSDQTQMDDLSDWLADPSRKLPAYVLTLPEGSVGQNSCLIDAMSLARSTAGIATVFVVPQELTWTLTERFEQKRAVFGGAVRAYLAGFAKDADPFAHRLVVADRLQEPDAKAQCLRWMKNLAALESRKHSRLGQEVLPYTQIKSAAVSLRLKTVEARGGNDTEQISALRDKIKALESDIERVDQENVFYAEEHGKVEERAKEAEAENRSLSYQLQMMKDQLVSRAGNEKFKLVYPDEWVQFSKWCEDNFSGVLVLTSSARRGIKKADFDDVEAAARFTAWLVEHARQSFMGNSNLILRDCPIEGGIINAPCGSDAFEFDWNGRRLTADWHVKNGGNTRDPRRCLRIYYSWDDDTKQIVIADMPAHRKTEAS